jgi:hypothetical protein
MIFFFTGFLVLPGTDLLAVDPTAAVFSLFPCVIFAGQVLLRLVSGLSGHQTGLLRPDVYQATVGSLRRALRRVSKLRNAHVLAITVITALAGLLPTPSLLLLGQVELDLEITNSGNGNKSDKGTTSKGAAGATGNGTRKKSSSALQAEEEEGGSGKKTSKSSDDSDREHVRVSELRDAQAQCAQSANCGLINIGPEEASLVTTEATDQPQEDPACKDNTGKEGENGCGWINSQEVCPWEDEESCKKENHPPFVKTYATLGYL